MQKHVARVYKEKRHRNLLSKKEAEREEEVVRPSLAVIASRNGYVFARARRAGKTIERNEIGAE